MKEARVKRLHTAWSHLYDTVIKGKPSVLKQTSGFQGLRKRTGVTEGPKNIARVMQLSPLLTAGVVIWLYVLIKTHRTIHTKKWIFMYANYTSINKIRMKTSSSPRWGTTEGFIPHVNSQNGLAPCRSLQLAWGDNKDGFLALLRVASQLWHLCSLPAAGFGVSGALFLNHVFFPPAQYQNLKIISGERNWGSFWARINPNHSHSPLRYIRHVSFAPICSKTAN